MQAEVLGEVAHAKAGKVRFSLELGQFCQAGRWSSEARERGMARDNKDILSIKWHRAGGAVAMTVTENTNTGAPTRTTLKDGHSRDTASKLSDVELTYVPLRSQATEGTTAAQTSVEAPSRGVSLFVSALTLSIAIVAGLVIWAAVANPGMSPFT